MQCRLTDRSITGYSSCSPQRTMPGQPVSMLAGLEHYRGEGRWAVRGAIGGTGGLVAPMMLYAPAGGKDAKLENLRPLGDTSPEFERDDASILLPCRDHVTGSLTLP